MEICDKSWQIMLENWTDLSKNSSFEILATIYKSIQQMVTKCKICVYRRFEETWKIYIDSINWIINDKPNTSTTAHARPLVIKLTPTIVESFKTIFSAEIAKECELVLNEKVLSSLYQLIRKILSSTSVLEGLHGITNPIRLIGEERSLFEFIEYLPKIFMKEEAFNGYFEFLIEFLNFKIDDPHSDGFIRKVLLIIKNYVVAYGLPKDLVKGLIKKLYPKFSQIIGLRFQNDICKILLFNAKECQPLWYDVGEFFVNFSTYLASPKIFKEAVPIMEESSKEPRFNEEVLVPPVNYMEIVKSEEFNKRTQELLEDKELQELVWDQIIKLIKEILKVSDSSLNNLDRAIAEEVIKKSQELDITLINFILKTLLPSSSNLRKEAQQELINLIDNGCTAFNTSFSGSSTHSRPGDTLSKFCISTLLSLCNSSEDVEKEFLTVKQKIATITTPVLVNRCKAIFHKYMADEKRSGQVPLPKYFSNFFYHIQRNRKQDLIELLSKLRTTTIFTNALPKKEGCGIVDLLSGGKAHLIYLMPEIVECISSKETDLRDAIKEALQEINKMLLGELAELKKIGDSK